MVMRTATTLPLLLAIAACSYDARTAAPTPDAAAADARPLGVLDGDCAGEAGRPRVLVYTYENMWRHMSNLFARGAVYAMCETRGFNVKTTNDPKEPDTT